MIEHRSRLIAGRHDRNLLDGFLAPPQRSRDFRTDQLRTNAQVLKNSFRLFVRTMEQQRAVFFMSSELFDIGEQLRLRLKSKAFNLADQALLAGRLEIADVFNAQCLIESDNLFEVQARHLAELHSPARQLLAELLQHPTFAGTVNLLDDRRQRLADSGDFR